MDWTAIQAGKGDRVWPEFLRDSSLVHQMLVEMDAGIAPDSDLAVLEQRVGEIYDQTEERVKQLIADATASMGRPLTDDELAELLTQNLVTTLGLLMLVMNAIPSWAQELMRIASQKRRDSD